MIRLMAVGAAAFVSVLGAVSIYLGIQDKPACNAAVALTGNGSIGGPFTLVNASGNQVTDQDIIVRPSLIYFGYSYCPDVCPFDNSRNADALELLIESGINAQAVFVTVDPQRDTPDVVGQFAAFFHDSMIGLTGTDEQVRATADAYRVYYQKNGEGDDYLVDHSTFTYLMIPELGLADYYRRTDSAELIAERSACLINAVS